MVICLKRGADDLHNGPADATPSSLASLNLDCFNLSGAGIPRLSWKTGC